jgi:hypothetical protein
MKKTIVQTLVTTVTATLTARQIALYSPFADQFLDFESRLAAAKLPCILFMGHRTFEDQDEHYAQGGSVSPDRSSSTRGGMNFPIFTPILTAITLSDSTIIGVIGLWNPRPPVS